MSADSWLRVALLFIHLLLCVAALALVVKTDLRVLRRRVSPQTMGRVHRRLVWLLAGLWASGGAVLLLDLGGDLGLLLERPKLLAKVACVALLTANAWLLRRHALPRITAQRVLSPGEARALAVAGAVSTASWLLAAFLGLAKPIAAWSVTEALAFYAVVMLGAALVALLVVPGRLARRQLGTGQTAVEQAAETLDFASRLSRFVR
jgi:hypothetical protein